MIDNSKQAKEIVHIVQGAQTEEEAIQAVENFLDEEYDPGDYWGEDS